MGTSGQDPPYGPTLALGLIGAVAVAVGVTKSWVTASADFPGLPTIEASASGADLAPLAGALGVVVLAAFGAVMATRGMARRMLGLLIVTASVVIVVAAVRSGDAGPQLEADLSAKGWSGGAYATADHGWRWIALAGGVLCALAGGLVSWFGGRWATMGSRYDAPSTAGETRDADESTEPASLSESDVWREIDRGRDPTQTS